jgi:Tol biopolymer transport system component
MHIGVDSTLRPLLAEPHGEWKPVLSADCKWLADVSSESGTTQVFVRPFPDVQAGKWQISLDRGTDPVWSADGRELFFRSLGGDQVFSADMARGPGMAERRMVTRAPSEPFEVNGQDRMFDVAPDGRRFLMSVSDIEDLSGNLVVVQNFTAHLRAALAR